MRLDDQLRKRLDVSDIVQETQIEVTRRLEGYLEHEPIPFRPWLHQIARERLLKARRHHLGTAGRAVSREIPLPDHSSLQLARNLLKDESSPSQHVAKKELARRVREGLGRLPEIDREILLMRNFEELTFEDIGYVLDINPATARKRHGRALLRLTNLLHRDGLTESQI